LGDPLAVREARLRHLDREVAGRLGGVLALTAAAGGEAGGEHEDRDASPCLGGRGSKPRGRRPYAVLPQGAGNIPPVIVGKARLELAARPGTRACWRCGCRWRWGTESNTFPHVLGMPSRCCASGRSTWSEPLPIGRSFP